MNFYNLQLTYHNITNFGNFYIDSINDKIKRVY